MSIQVKLVGSPSKEKEELEKPSAYPKTCLSDKKSSLLTLARHVFNNQSQKSNSKWEPSSIQLQSWPIIEKKINLVAIASTGSGKTFAYAIPIIHSCHSYTKSDGVHVNSLVLVPTRELAQQVSKTLKIVCKSANKLKAKGNKSLMKSLAIYGGVDKADQIKNLLENKSESCTWLNIASTPMRLIDILGIGGGDNEPNKDVQRLFKSIKYLVLDEADRLATASDMSEQIDTILKFLKKKAKKMDQWSLFSATMPERARENCEKWIPLPKIIVEIDAVTVGNASATASNESKSKLAEEDTPDQDTLDSTNQEEGDEIKNKKRGPLNLSTIPSNITQTLHVCSNHKKPKKLLTTIKKIRDNEKKDGGRRRKGLMIVFFGKIKTLQYIHKTLLKEGVQCVTLHSQMNQQKRDTQLNNFKSGKMPIMLATDIAARGVHCNNVEYIINYDFPSSLEQYVHRCGRAGRNKVSDGDSNTQKQLQATVYSFFHRELAAMANDVIELLRTTNSWIDPNLVALVPNGVEGLGESKRKRRRKGKDDQQEKDKEKPKADEVPSTKNSLKNVDLDDDEDEFAFLAPNRIVLARASHVPDSDSDIDSDDAK